MVSRSDTDNCVTRIVGQMTSLSLGHLTIRPVGKSASWRAAAFLRTRAGRQRWGPTEICPEYYHAEKHAYQLPPFTPCICNIVGEKKIKKVFENVNNVEKIRKSLKHDKIQRSGTIMRVTDEGLK